MSLRGRLFAAGYDRMLARVEKAGLHAHRESLLSDATGRVLEIGAGTGLNLDLYGDAVESLTVTEPEEPMAQRLEAKLPDLSRDVTVVRAPAEDLPFPDDEFDTVVATLVLCTVADQPRALREARRVLKPGGRLLFIEHVRSDDRKLAKWQDRMNGVNRFVAYGCNCNRSTVDAIRGAGFDVDELERGELPKAPPFARPLVIGRAVANGRAYETGGGVPAALADNA